jgi:hypothetical protein
MFPVVLMFISCCILVLPRLVKLLVQHPTEIGQRVWTPFSCHVWVESCLSGACAAHVAEYNTQRVSSKVL